MSLQGDVTRLVRWLRIPQEELSYMIERTPTGPVRDEMTEVNIFLLEAIDKLEKLS